MFPVAEKKANALLDRLKNITSEDAGNEFIMRGFEKEAEAIRDDDPATGYSLLGLIHTFRADAEKTIYYHQRALDLEPGTPVLWNNFAVSMGRLFRFEEADTYAEKAHGLARHDLFFLDTYLDTKQMRFRFHEADEIVSKMLRLSPLYESPRITIVKAAKQIMDSNEIVDSDYSKIAAIVSDLVKPRKLFAYEDTLEIKNEAWLRKTFFLNIEMVEAIEMQAKLYERMSPEIPAHVARTIEIRFTTGDMPDFELTDRENSDQIAAYEKQFGMDSNEFLTLLKSGNAPDTFETNVWRALLERS